MPGRLRPLPPAELAALLTRYDEARRSAKPPQVEDERRAVQHFLAVLEQRHPGRSVEVRVPPYAAVQCIEGARHTRGTPPAVVETDAVTWLGVARGRLDFAAGVRDGRVRASGERSDLSRLLPLT
ncbi:MAG: sterol carrier family protein [Nocardioidaceae bacterium]